VETIGSKRSYALTWCMPNNDDDDEQNKYQMISLDIKSSEQTNALTSKIFCDEYE